MIDTKILFELLKTNDNDKVLYEVEKLKQYYRKSIGYDRCICEEDLSEVSSVVNQINEYAKKNNLSEFYVETNSLEKDLHVLFVDVLRRDKYGSNL